MTNVDPAQRPPIDHIRHHKWMKAGPIASPEEIAELHAGLLEERE